MIEYIPCGDYFIPDLKLKETPPIGKYGRMRKRFLEEHRPFLFNKLILSESLFPHLLEIEAAANRRIEEILPALMKDAGVTENLKAADPMKWVGLMNTCHAQAEEIVLAELIYN
ncbi:MAG: TnpV protein [Clostridia bacterium]|nr:TnpV protein [Clostridia bacterium]